jgi:hypothetical protein
MAEQETGIVIANPIYDAVFKSLMTGGTGKSRDIAGFFIGAILGEKITEIKFLDKETSYFKKRTKNVDGKEETETLSLVRLDFVATIRTKNGEYRKVLIEIQKSKKTSDLLRFRTYLGEQYKVEDTIKIKNKQIEQSLPIVVIYMLGFNLQGVEPIVVKVDRKYLDVIANAEIEGKSPFIESLTHDGYFIQIPRINREAFPAKWEKCSDLQQVLSLFEQVDFVEEDFFKKYTYPITNKKIKKMVETLAYLAADPAMRRRMQEEYWAARDEEIWESQVTTLTKENKKLSRKLETQSGVIETLSGKLETQSGENKNLLSENNKLRLLLQQAGISVL